MAYSASDYIEGQIIRHLRDLSEGKRGSNEVDWPTLYVEIRRCRELGIMGELHRQMQPFYEMYLNADPRLLSNKDFSLFPFVETLSEQDADFGHWAESYDLTDITEDWADYLRRKDGDIFPYKRLIRTLLEGGYDTDWQKLSEQLKEDLHEAEVYSERKTAELMCFLHGVAMLMNMPWDDKKKMDMFDMLDSKWDFMKHFYSIMIRRVIGCRLNGYASVANLVAQQPKYHQYIHIFYCVLCYRQDSLGLTSKQMKTLEKRMEAISNIMDVTKPSDELNELCDTLFPEDFQRMLDEFRPETREQVERERNRLRLEVGLLKDKITEMAVKLKNALEHSVPITDIKHELLQLSPGAALDILGKLTMMLSDNEAWMKSVPEIKEAIMEKQKEKEMEMAELLRVMKESPKVGVTVQSGATAQITEKEIVNGLPNLLEQFGNEHQN